MFTLEQGVACKVFTLNRSFLIPNINHHHLYAVYIISWGSTYHEYCVTNISCFLYNDQRRSSGWSYWMLCNSLLIVSWSCFVVLLWYHHHFITALLMFPEYLDYLLLMLCCAVLWWGDQLIGDLLLWTGVRSVDHHSSGNTSQVSVLRSPAPVLVWENITIYLQWVWE